MPSFRTYNSPGGQQVYGIQYVFDVASGLFRPAYTTDFAATVSVGSVAITGVAPISGIIQFASTQNVNVVNTPFVSVANTAPIAVSGSVQSVNVESGLATVSNDAVSGSTGVVLAANSNRLAWFIQNLHTGGLMVRLGNTLPSTGNLNFILKGGTVINDGLGASWTDSPAIYRGNVSVSGLGGSPTLYTAWQIP